MARAPQLSPYGKSLLKALGGNAKDICAKKATYWGLDHPQSVLNLIPEEISQVVLSLPTEILKHSDGELEKATGGITRQDRRVRLLFWEEYENAAREARSMNLEWVAENAGLPTWNSYGQRLYENPPLMAWVMRPPPHYELQMREAQELGIDRLMEIMQLPIEQPVYDKKGNLLVGKDGKPVTKADVGVGMLIMQCYRLVDQRRHGGYTQKTVNMNLDANKVPEGASLSMEEVESRLKELSEKLGENIPGIAPPEPRAGEIEVQAEVEKGPGNAGR